MARESPTSKVILASSIGTTIDYYDLFIAGFTAATVWPSVFYPVLLAPIAIALSIVTYVVPFLLKPFGAFLFGHFGDKYGRKPMLILTLLMMGISAAGIGLTPSYASIGIAAPLLIVAFRALFGIGAGGEYGGAISWTSERVAGSKRRAFLTSWVLQAIPLGLALSTVSFFFAASAMTPAAFKSWGWRIPFLLGAAMVVLAIFIRLRLEDSPLFLRLKKTGTTDKKPAITVLRLKAKRIMLLSALVAFAPTVITLESVPFSLNYLSINGFKISFIAFSIFIGSVFGVLTGIIGAILGDKYGRKPVALLSASLTLISSPIFFLLINTGNGLMVILAQMLLLGSAFMVIGVLPAILSENFGTKYRYSGVGLSNNIGGVVTAVATILESVIIAGISGVVNAWPYVALLSMAISALSIIAMLFLKETKDVNLSAIR